jgi:hypothetical protein
MELESARAEETPFPVPDMSSPSNSFANLSFIKSISASIPIHVDQVYAVVVRRPNKRKPVEPEGISTFFGAALDPWLLDSVRFCNGGSGAATTSSSSSMLPLPLQLHSEDDDDDGDGEEEKDGLDAMTRRPGRNLSRLPPRPRNPRTITTGSGTSRDRDRVAQGAMSLLDRCAHGRSCPTGGFGF